jgi:soluble lytic murein transglycosylase-like protein
MRRALGTYLLGAVLAGPITGGMACAQDGAVDPVMTSTSSSCAAAESAETAALVRKIAVEEGFDPDLAEAVAFVESSLGQRQESGAGALGTMQLMPGTASDLGVADRCDPAENIRGGVRYLKSLYDQFRDPLLMLAAYNAGSGRVYEKSGIPEFDETAKYVVKVMNRWKLSAKVKTSNPRAVPVASQDVPLPGIAATVSQWKDNHVIEVQ